ncbi:serine protease 50 precursor [Nasonia vitripennis]|uniref:chymotrypsin n=1 Tax=Nasonia vitripennis TaxID=7425 RepID=A0A7M6UVW8_NASVI|nr:serine protease 50 precursor [Nasonia vitripennis]
MSFKLVLLTSLLAVTQATPFLGFDPLITGGQAARKAEFPYLVSLQRGDPPNVAHFCAGSIIKPKWILTAGHCVTVIPAGGTLIIKAGKYLIKQVEKDEQVVEVNRTIVHEKYPGNVAPNDIALIKLKTPLKFNANVAAIKLPEANSQPTGVFTFTGWGSVSLNSKPSYPNVLQKVDVTLVDLYTCKLSIERITGSAPLDQGNMCTGPLSGGISACSRDSGGPLIGRDRNGTVELVGVSSWGVEPCGLRGAPSVHVKVSSYIDWINKHIGKHC